MKGENRKWTDPVKNIPAKPETLAIKGDFEKFTADMRKVLRTPKTENGKPTSASPSPAVSS